MNYWGCELGCSQRGKEGPDLVGRPQLKDRNRILFLMLILFLDLDYLASPLGDKKQQRELKIPLAFFV